MGNSKSKSPHCKVPDFNRVASDDALMPESGIVYTANDSETKVQGTVQFLDGNPSYVTGVDSLPDPSRLEAHDPNVDIQNFFKRPVKITDVEWSVGGGIATQFNPWELWFRNKRVGNRLSNYRLFSGNLHLQFVLNGNQFYWGRALVAYAPLQNSRGGFLTNVIDADLMRMSQKPHLWIDPCSSQGGHMECPFFWQDNQFDLTVNNANNLGTVYMNSLVSLTHMNNQSRAVNISVYAWCENVTLSAPTQTNIASLVAQSGTGDEYGQGIISKPASIVQQMAGSLSNVPAIGPYARATQVVAGAVGSVARAFGYSQPRDLRPVTSVAMSQVGDLATTDGEDNTQTLGLTQKNEVTIDPRTTGLGDVDELAFDHWCAKESYVVTAPWTLAMNENAPIFSIGVTPSIYRLASYPLYAKTGWATTPTTIAAAPFGFWKGTMTYRFQVVASGYHKGRLLVVWDPVTSAASPETNTVYTRIVDIADTKDFEITVGWGASRPGLLTKTPNLAVENFAVGALYNADTSRMNGVLSVYVLNPLVTSGASTEDVQLVVSSKSNDLKCWGPTTAIKNLSFFQPPNDPVARMVKESGVIEMSDEVDAVNAAPESGTPLEDVGSHSVPEALATLTGDPFTSWRPLLKRKALYMSYPTNFTSLWNKYTKIELRGTSSPAWRGYLAGAAHTDKNGIPFNANPTTVYELVASCFIGWRGTMRYKMVQMVTAEAINAGFNVNPMQPISTIVTRGLGDFYENTVSQYTADPVNAMYLATESDRSSSGAQIATANMDGVLSFELPWYSSTRFQPVYAALALDLGWEVTRIFLSWTQANANSQVDVYRSIGEDFNFFFFAGTPVFWNLPITPDV